MSNDVLFPNCMQLQPYDFGAMVNQEWFVDEIIGHQWEGQNLVLEVRWSLGDTTWELLENCKDLTALDRYVSGIARRKAPCTLGKMRSEERRVGKECA